MKPLEYAVLKECSCGPEELHVLQSLVDFEEAERIRDLVVALESLVDGGCLECRMGATRHLSIDSNELFTLVADRQNRGENLEDYPLAGQDYAFFTTERGVGLLSINDRPVQS